MKGRPDNNPTSWVYQANIHRATLPSNSWPAGAPFSTCQHNNMFFLSWHRMYLYFFERILRAASGYSSFALPYWNYGVAGQASLPPPFRGATIGATPNSLFDNTRSSAVNAGTALPVSAVGAGGALAETSFLGAGNFQSLLENTPHGSVHGTIGGNMGNFAGAGRDPIFWLHHCNIDRLWEEWLSQGGGRTNPTGNSAWMDQDFTFVDENQNFITLSGAEVVFTASQLRYQYDQPRTCIPLVLALDRPLLVQLANRPRVLDSVLIARGVKVPPDQSRIDLRIEPPEMRERAARLLSPERLATTAREDTALFVRFEGVRTEEPLDGYFEVYVGLPQDVRPDSASPFYVGNLSTFGADRESRSGSHQQHGREMESGLTVELDVSETLRQTASRGTLGSGEGLSVTLVPVSLNATPQARFNPRAAPEIDAVVLSLVQRTVQP